jgi:hypothetical protein
MISSSQGRYLHMTTQTQNKRTQTSMPRVGFEPTFPVFERAKTLPCSRPRGHCDRQVQILLLKNNHLKQCYYSA